MRAGTSPVYFALALLSADGPTRGTNRSHRRTIGPIQSHPMDSSNYMQISNLSAIRADGRTFAIGKGNASGPQVCGAVAFAESPLHARRACGPRGRDRRQQHDLRALGCLAL